MARIAFITTLAITSLLVLAFPASASVCGEILQWKSC
jgi:hypothetical protein